jgi:hypothetical protein
VTLPAIPADVRARLLHLCDVVDAEVRLLGITDRELFVQPFDAERAALLATDNAAAEKVDAFAARFGRLQDTAGDKLLPALLTLLGHAPAPVIDNLNAAERLGWIAAAVDWLELRQLRNRLVHEYIRQPVVLADALQAAHRSVPALCAAAQRLAGETRLRLGG